jgi:hypothetical protein
MLVNKYLKIIFFVLIFNLSFTLQAFSYAPKPVTPAEEKLLRKMEEQSRVEGQRAGNYNENSHVFNSALQLGLILGLIGLGGFSVYTVAKIIPKNNKIKGESGAEQRNWARLNAESSDLRCQMQAKYRQTRDYLTRIKDISRGGVGLEVEQIDKLSPGDKIRLKFEKGIGAPVKEVTGIIRWAAGKKVGVQFDHILDASFEALQAFVNQSEPAVVRN